MFHYMSELDQLKCIYTQRIFFDIWKEHIQMSTAPTFRENVN